MITLSYSTLSSLMLQPHTWLNRQMGLETVEHGYMTQGKENHKIIQAHLIGAKRDPRLERLNGLKFTTVETTEKDKKTLFTRALDKKYSIKTYMDGFNKTQFLEIKTGNPPMPFSKFVRSYQRKLNAFIAPQFKEAVLISATRDLKKITVYPCPLTEKDRQEALEWVKKGIHIIENIKQFRKEEGRCQGCGYESQCQYT